MILKPRKRARRASTTPRSSRPGTREALEVEIKAKAVAWGVGFASVEEIADLNILHATGLAMRRAVEALAVAPAFALVDGNYRFDLPCEVKTVVGGDAISASIAAASILAKTARDRLMAQMDEVYPGYGFAGHKGYRAPDPRRGAAAAGALPDPPHGLGPGAAGADGQGPDAGVRGRHAGRAAVRRPARLSGP